MNEKMFLPTSLETVEAALNEAGFGDIATTGPTFENTFSKEIANENKPTSGWGTRIQTFFTTNKSSFFALGGLLIAIAIIVAAGALSRTDKTAFNLSTITNMIQGTEVNTPTITDTATTLQTNTFVEKAAAGEGVTHLARRTLAAYLTQNNIELSAEQKVYAEDFLKDTVGSFELTVGQEIQFSQENIKAAVDGAQALQEWQIRNLTQYTQGG